MKYDCVIVGGGAAGLCCAAALHVDKGIILEGTHRLGSKLLLTGGGRCNVTHSGSIKDFIPLYGDCGRKLRSILYKHSNQELIDILKLNGISTVTEDGGRVFPSSMKSSSILNLLLAKIQDNAWEISTDSKITAISCYNSSDSYGKQEYTLHLSNDRSIKCDKLVIACGGITFPGTGSDGSIFNIFARDLGTNIIEPRSALAPIELVDYPYCELAGVSLSEVTLTLCQESGKIITKEHGDILFAHRELSGPSILNISRYAHPGYKLSIDYSACPAIPRRLSKLRDSLPISTKKKPTHRISESVDEFVIKSVGANGMVTVGGVSLDAIDTKTMELKSHPGIYIIGEALNADGPTGGYNLQLCYSTARATADAIASTII